MSNHLTVRRVRIQTLSPDGQEIGEPSYGVLAQDNYEQAFTEAYGSLDELNRAIDRYGGILELVRESGQFEHVDDSLGWDNVDRYISHGG